MVFEFSGRTAASLSMPNVWSRTAHQQSESGATIRPDHSAQSGEMRLSVVLFRVERSSRGNHWIDNGFDTAPIMVAQDDFSRLHDAGAADFISPQEAL
ncbi:hypothetical protein [Mesorhizobium sp. M0118]|uniref:hypothetical protein n=1 Tax=Mesorhizobium sp. M0118 TaxID=2956884 RepID=UPI003338E82E